MCFCVFMYTVVQVSIEARRGRQISLELELQVVLSNPVWVLETQLRFFARVVGAINARAIAPALIVANLRPDWPT